MTYNFGQSNNETLFTIIVLVCCKILLLYIYHKKKHMHRSCYHFKQGHQRAATFAITVNIKCSNDQIHPERHGGEKTKVKQSSRPIVYYLVNYLVTFLIFMLNLLTIFQKHMCMDVSLNYGSASFFLPK